MIYDTVIKGVTSKVVNRKSDGKAITIFTVTDETGREWTTSRRDLAGESNRLLDMPARLSGREEQRGTWTNTYLEEIQALNGYSAAPAPVPTPQAAPSFTLPSPPQARIEPPAPAQTHILAEGEGTPKDLSIWRQTACKVAAHLSSDPNEFKTNVEELLFFFRFGTWPPEFAPQPSPVTHGNQFIPPSYEDDPGRESDPHYVDDDIPF